MLWGNILSKQSLVIIISALGICACSPKSLGEHTDLPEMPLAGKLQEGLNQVLEDHATDQELGISAAVIAPGYRPWTGVSGYSHPGVPITADMMFDAGSIQKNFEAVLALNLAEDGLLSLDDPISQYLPAYANVDEAITIRQLLNHTSGVFNVFEHPDFPWVGAGVDYSKRWEMDETFNTFVLEPYGPPGYAQHYSSTNYLLLTAIIENLTGNSVPDEIEHRLLNPMKLEGIYISMGEAPPPTHSVAHPWVDTDQDGVLDDIYGIPLTWKVSLTHPVIFSTAGGLAHWIHALYHEGAVLGPNNMNEMLTYPEPTVRDPDGGLYGLGVVNYRDVLGMEAIGHGGSSLGYSAAALYLPEYGISVTWLINTGESPSDLANQMMSSTWSLFSEVIRANQDEFPDPIERSISGNTTQ